MKRIIVGISGASGVIYGIRLLEVLSTYRDIETHLVMTQTARHIIHLETSWLPQQVERLASRVYQPDDLCAPISSGSFVTDGMVVAPCSVKSMSGIACAFAENLLIRAAEVSLKERRRLVLLVRETPLHLGHLRSLMHLAQIGAVIMPPVPAFYHRPRTIEDILNFTIGKILDQFDIPHELFPRWQGSGSDGFLK